ncbi:MAG: ion transporter [bacterium]|nr:ion transporter [bacterium]MCY3925053.1 ion transporter [bacterium]
MSGRILRDPFDIATRRGRLVEGGLALVVLASIGVLVAETTVDRSSTAFQWLRTADLAIWVVFCLEYAARLVAARPRRRYMFSFFGLVDLLAVLAGAPGLVGLRSVKILRILRAVRVLKLVRLSTAVDRFKAAFTDIRDELAIYLGATAVLTFLASYGIYEFEHEVNPHYGNIFECTYWAVASMTSGAEGYAPTTVGGKLLAMVLVLFGLGIVAVPSGLMASALAKQPNPGSEDGE